MTLRVMVGCVCSCVLGIVSVAGAQTLHWNKTGIPVSTSVGIQRAPVLATDGLDGAIIVWEDVGAGAPRLVAQRLDAGGRRLWDSSGVTLCAAAGVKALGDIVSDGNGGAIVCWWDRRNGNDYDLFAQRLSATGAILWTSNGIAVAQASGDQLLADMLPDGNGGVVIAWEDRRIAGDADVYAQRLTASGAALWTAAGRKLTTDPRDQIAPHLADDGSGGVYVVWTDKRTDDDIYAQRVDANGTALWLQNGVGVTALPARQIRPQIVSDGRGACVIVWEDYRNGTTSDVYYQKLDRSGSAQRTTGGEPLTRARNDQTNLALIADSFGGAIAAWADFRGGATADIYARRIDASGAAIWKVSGADSTNGVVVSNSTDTQEIPMLLPDGLGGMFCAWQDKRNAADFDLFMQSLYPGTTVRYPSGGGALLRIERNQMNLRMVSSGRSSAILAWQDGRVADGSADIYAQRVSFSAFAPDSIGFDSVTYGATREIRFPVVNAGPDTVTVTALGFTSTSTTDFLFTDAPGVPFFVRPGDSVMLGIKFVPRDRGYRANGVRLTYGAGSQHILGVSGIGLIPNHGSYPTSLAFGTRKVGIPVDTTLRGILKNNGYGALIIHTMRFDGLNADAFSLVNAPALPLTLNTNDSIPLTIRYTPRFNGSESAALTMLSNGGSAVRALSCSGTGVYPTSAIAPMFLRFDSSNGTPVTRSFVVKSTGAVPLRVLSADVLGVNPRDFTTTLAPPVTLRPGDSIIVPVSFVPRNNGVRQAYLRLTLDQLTPVVSVAMIGSGYNVATSVETVTPDGLIIGSVYPNPLHANGGDGVLPVYLPASQHACRALLTVNDVLGRVEQVNLLDLEPGESLLLALPVRHLSPGVHIVTIDVPNADRPQRYTQRFVVQ